MRINSGGNYPRSIGFSDCGGYLLVGNQGSRNVGVPKIVYEGEKKGHTQKNIIKEDILSFLAHPIEPK